MEQCRNDAEPVHLEVHIADRPAPPGRFSNSTGKDNKPRLTPSTTKKHRQVNLLGIKAVPMVNGCVGEMHVWHVPKTVYLGSPGWGATTLSHRLHLPCWKEVWYKIS